MGHESIWTAGPERFMVLPHHSQERALHPALLERIESVPGDQLLDYGCGDGRLLERLPSRWVVDAFDPSAQMRRIARARVGNRLRSLASASCEVAGPYDVILLGMVILCIPERDEVMRVLGDCASKMHASSRLFVTTTHPCFRTWRFSNFATSFCDDQSFTYMEEGLPFDVTLRDPGTDGVTFTDYHWPLGITVQMICSQGLVIDSLVEVPDDPKSTMRNALVPPFLMFECRRTS